jgi:hypothetical protein
MSRPTVADCVAIWNGDANAEVRAAAVALRPREVYASVVQAAGGILDGPPPLRCVVFFRDPGDDGVPPSMLAIGTTRDGTRFDLAGARTHHGSDNTSLGGRPNAVRADDGTLSLLDPPQPLPEERAE